MKAPFLSSSQWPNTVQNKPTDFTKSGQRQNIPPYLLLRWNSIPWYSLKVYNSIVFSMVRVVLLLLLLSRFSRVRLCATPQTAARQAPPSLGFSRQEHWSGFLQCRKAKSESEVAQSCPTLCDPTDCSPPGSSIHGIFQARVLEWVASVFSETNV